MSDIIKDAKQLLDGATPAPWELYGGEIHHIQHTPEQCTSFRCDHRWPVLSENWGENPGVAAADEDLTLMAAAPELAQALAEETYEYSFQVQNTIDMWEHPSCAGEPDRWWDTESEAEGAALAAHEYGYPIRIVRRRVSTVEVCCQS